MVISVLHYRASVVAVATRAIASAPGRDLSGIQFYPT